MGSTPTPGTHAGSELSAVSDRIRGRSADIRALCGWALDLAGVDWRASGAWMVSVSRRDAVARLDELIGPEA